MAHLRFYITSFSLIFCFLFNRNTALAQPQYREGELNRETFILHYKIFGTKGLYLIILGGGPGSVVDYTQPVADSLSKFFQCIMQEQRGTCRSVLKNFDTTTIRMDLYVDDIEVLRKHSNRISS